MQKRTQGAWFVWINLVWLLPGCSPGSEVLPESDLNYFPLRKGLFWVYEVDSTVYFQNVARRVQYRVEVSVADSVRDGRGQTWYRLDRVRTEPASGTTRPLITWSAAVSQQELIVREGNTGFVRLVFPASVGRSWNGNAHNTLGGDEFCEGVGACDRYAFRSKGSATVLGQLYPDVWEVEESNVADRLVKFDVRTSRYARGVGLIDRQYEVLTYCTLPACFGRQFIESGVTYSQQLVRHGIR